MGGAQAILEDEANAAQAVDDLCDRAGLVIHRDDHRESRRDSGGHIVSEVGGGPIQPVRWVAEARSIRL